MIAFSASRPVAAASAMEAIPVTSRLKTSGMIVIRRALSHNWPSPSTRATVPVPPGMPYACAAAPAARPPTRATNTQRLSEEKRAAVRERVMRRS
jgi:hypothetical protein